MGTAVVARLAVPDALEQLASVRSLRARLDAYETLLLARLAGDPDPYGDGHADSGKDWIREDVACVLHLAPVTAGARMHTATRLVHRFAATVESMRSGRLPGYYASRLVEATGELPESAARRVEQRVLARAAEQTVSQFGAALRRAVHAADPRSTEDRHAAARTERRVVFHPPQTDGMVTVWALLPADRAAVLEARVRALADTWSDLDDGRTADQRRADALCALGSSGDGTASTVGAPVTARINVTVAATTLLGLDEGPADLNGHPVAAAIARRIAHDPTSRWRRLLTDDTGRLVDVTATTYRPPAAMARFVALRDRTCQFPGCQRAAARCEQDHVTPWSRGGPTTPANLTSLCRRHHHLKHDTPWTLTRHADGAHTWRSPTGHTRHRAPPEPVLRA